FARPARFSAAVLNFSTSHSLCQELFSSFFKLFCSLIRSAVRPPPFGNFDMLPHLSCFVKNFFRTSQSISKSSASLPL
ncbi:hypothetical protein AAAT68_16245, partial [Lawsonibacter asaccharolyticus]